MAQAITARPVEELVNWPAEGLSRVPMQVFSDPEVYMWEQDLIFRGPTWNFLGFEIEAPRPNDFFTSVIGDTPIIVVHTAEGTLNAFVNRCVHKGATICYQPSGSCVRFTCPYHNWIYDQSGKLLSVAFEKGLPGQDGQRQGGMPPDFDKSQHRLRRLRVETIAGLIFGTFSEDAPPLEAYLGPVMANHIRRTLHGRPKILTKYRQVMYNNWKLYAENARDNYHPSLLHSFFVTFKLNRLSAEGGVRQDDRNWHHIVFAKKHTDKGAAEYDFGTIRAQKDNFGLKDPSLIDLLARVRRRDHQQHTGGLSYVRAAAGSEFDRNAAAVAAWTGKMRAGLDADRLRGRQRRRGLHAPQAEQSCRAGWSCFDGGWRHRQLRAARHQGRSRRGRDRDDGRTRRWIGIHTRDRDISAWVLEGLQGAHACLILL